MIQLGAPYTQPELVAAFSAENAAVHQFFDSLSTEQFFATTAPHWSPAENLIHLFKSSQPVVVGLKAPKLLLRLRFGRAKQPSTSVAAVRTHYTQVALAGGGVASGAYIPTVREQSAAEKRHILAKWQSTGADLVTALGKWSEADLDRLHAPHPLLGMQTIRDLLFFTLYHNLHHVNDVQRLFEQPESEWFDPVFTR